MHTKELINELRKGDERVLAKLYFQYRNPFIIYASDRYEVDHNLVKEAYHNTILAFYYFITDGKLNKLSCPLKTYIFQLGMVMVFKELEKAGKEPKLRTDKKKKIECEFPEEYFIDDQNDLLSMVKTELGSLDEKTNKLFKLYYYEKKNLEEITVDLNFKSKDEAKKEKFKTFEKIKIYLLTKHSFN